jgi:hypothetical protein
MLIAALADHIVKPAFVYRNQWRVGDLLMWDNCTVQHRAIQDYDLAATPANAPNDYGRGSSTLEDLSPMLGSDPRSDRRDPQSRPKCESAPA